LHPQELADILPPADSEIDTIREKEDLKQKTRLLYTKLNRQEDISQEILREKLGDRVTSGYIRVPRATKEFVEIVLTFDLPNGDSKQIFFMCNPHTDLYDWSIPQSMQEYPDQSAIITQALMTFVSSVVDFEVQSQSSSDEKTVHVSPIKESHISEESKKKKRNVNSSEYDMAQGIHIPTISDERPLHIRDGVRYSIQRPSKKFIQKNFKHLPPESIELVQDAISGFNVGESKDFKKLHGTNLYQIRVGDIRIILEVNSTQSGRVGLKVVGAGDRAHIYEKSGLERPRRG
jgi:mRNA-degrading endonuclease RelE of RelBE toxin-antitoxin system